MKFAVVVFPGSNCDHDCVRAVELMGASCRSVWHSESTLGEVDAVILPGGFSYGDYLRPGAIARFSPVMKAVRAFADRGGLVIGICNGFQILLECGLLPGTLLRNNTLKFTCRPVWLRREHADSPFSRCGEALLKIPVAHGLGQYFIEAEGLRRITGEGQILYRYTEGPGVETPFNPNGSTAEIAGVLNAKRNVLGMMPHPERAMERAIGGSEHGRAIFASMMEAVA